MMRRAFQEEDDGGVPSSFRNDRPPPPVRVTATVGFECEVGGSSNVNTTTSSNSRLSSREAARVQLRPRVGDAGSGSAEKPYQCDACGKTLRTADGLRTHSAKHVVSAGKPYECALCHVWFATPGELEEHCRKRSKTHPVDKPHECTACGMAFATAKALQTHFNRVHGRRFRYGCNDCGMAFVSIAELQEHSAEVHPQPREQFAEAFLSTQELQDDFAEVNPQTREQCLEYEEALLPSRELQKHSAQVHAIRRQPRVQCSVCPKTFGSSEALKDHSVVHRRRSIHKCAQCGREFRLFKALKDHSVVHRRTSTHKCTMCDKVFSTTEGLRHHRSARHDVRGQLHHCPACKEAFVTAEELREHSAEVHQPRRQQQQQTQQQRQHQQSTARSQPTTPIRWPQERPRSHPGEKPYTCTTDVGMQACGKRTRDDTHAEKKPHEDKVRRKTLSGSDKLNVQHQLAVMDYKPRESTVCRDSGGTGGPKERQKPRECNAWPKTPTRQSGPEEVHQLAHSEQKLRECYVRLETLTTPRSGPQKVQQLAHSHLNYRKPITGGFSDLPVQQLVDLDLKPRESNVHKAIAGGSVGLEEVQLLAQPEPKLHESNVSNKARRLQVQQLAHGEQKPRESTVCCKAIAGGSVGLEEVQQLVPSEQKPCEGASTESERRKRDYWCHFCMKTFKEEDALLDHVREECGDRLCEKNLMRSRLSYY